MYKIIIKMYPVEDFFLFFLLHLFLVCFYISTFSFFFSLNLVIPKFFSYINRWKAWHSCQSVSDFRKVVPSYQIISGYYLNNIGSSIFKWLNKCNSFGNFYYFSRFLLEIWKNFALLHQISVKHFKTKLNPAATFYLRKNGLLNPFLCHNCLSLEGDQWHEMS